MWIGLLCIVAAAPLNQTLMFVDNAVSGNRSMLVNICGLGVLGGVQAGCEVADAAGDVSEGGFEGVLGVQPERIRNGPVDSSQIRDFLMGVIAHGHDKVFVMRHLIQPARGQVRESDAMAAGNINGARGDAVRGMRSRRGRREFRSTWLPEGGGQLGPGAVARADEEDAAGSVFAAGSQSFQGARGEPDVAAALVRFRAVAAARPALFQRAQVMGQQV